MIDNLKLKVDSILPLRDVVFETLRQAIITGEIEPGEKLLEVHIAKTLGVSRTPVREAIHSLELEGLAEINPRHGACVTKITEKSMKEVLEVRRALDTLTTELACERITEKQIMELERACTAFENAVAKGDSRDIAATDVAFHNIIIEATGNEKLKGLLKNISEQMYRYRYTYIKDDSQHEQLIMEHRIICDSLKRRDKESAVKAAQTHIDNQEAAIISKIKSEQKA